MYNRLFRAVFLLLGLCSAITARALVPCTLPVDAGETVATCFSGLQYPLPSTAPYAADPNGYVVSVIDTRIPPQPTNPVPTNDVSWGPPNFENASGLPQHQWTATNLGQVFGMTMDNAPAPNIYVAATTVYGDFPAGPGGRGAVYRLDGVTGDICLILQLPNFGPALGQLAFDPNSNHLFISNFEDGLIYSVSLTSPNGSACSLGTWTTYDHGVSGRPNEGLTIISDAGTNNTFTAKGRRVWGLCVNQGRLYYSVWWEDNGYPPNATENNEIWSVQIDGSGNCVASTAIREVVMPIIAADNTSGPVSDIEFTTSGQMIVGEHTMQADIGGVHLGSNPAHHSRVLGFTGSSGSFTMLPDNTYRTGKFYVGNNSAGGVTSDCEENVWSMVDAIHYGSSTGDTDFVYGLQRILAGGNAADSTATVNSVIIGVGPTVSNGYFKSQLGDIDQFDPCDIMGEGEGEGEPEGEPEGEGEGEGEDPCETITNGHADCISDATGQSIAYTFTLTNLSGIPAAWVLITPQTPGVTITPNMINVAIPNGGSTNITVNITGATPGNPICFTVTMLDRERKECCSQTICIENPCDCVIIPVDKQKIECDPTTPGSYVYTFYLTNTSAFTLSHAYLYADSGGTITPNYIPLGSLPPGGTAGPFTVIISGATPGTEYCFTMTLHDKELRDCCSYKHCIQLEDCCKPDGTPPVITINGPATVDCGTHPQYDVTAIDKCDGDVSYTLKAEGQVNWFVNGTYCVTITATDTSGNVATEVFCITIVGCDNGAAGKLLSADMNADSALQLTELIRVIQFYNTGGLHPDSFSEDGFAPGYEGDNTTATRHSSDYLAPYWKIDLSELLRLVQLYNAGGYHDCEDAEDGVCAGK